MEVVPDDFCVSEWLAFASLFQVMRLRGGVKRATVKTEEDEDDLDEDSDVAEGSGAISALTGVFANVRWSCD